MLPSKLRFKKNTSSSFIHSFTKAACSFVQSIRSSNYSQWLEEEKIVRTKEERIVSTKRPNECPKCGHKPLAEILYGLPNFKDPEFQRASAAGEITCGGCCITGMEATWQCVECGQKIWRPPLWDEKRALARYSASYRKRLFEETMKANGYKKREIPQSDPTQKPQNEEE